MLTQYFISQAVIHVDPIHCQSTSYSWWPNTLSVNQLFMLALYIVSDSTNKSCQPIISFDQSFSRRLEYNLECIA